MTRPIVIIESPFAGERERNLRYLARCLRDSILRGEAPFASHGLYTMPGCLNDRIPEERALGMSVAEAFLPVASLVAVYEDHGISAGMAAGVMLAELAGVHVVYRKIGEET